jgi:hypothetical protein
LLTDPGAGPFIDIGNGLDALAGGHRLDVVLTTTGEATEA